MLTEPAHFGGSLDDLRASARHGAAPGPAQGLPGHSGQVLEARAAGADAVLLITACLSDDELAAMLAAARELGMEPLVETHSDGTSSAPSRRTREVIGVNARDLETLEVDIDGALARLRRVPTDRVDGRWRAGSRPAEDVAAARWTPARLPSSSARR